MNGLNTLNFRKFGMKSVFAVPSLKLYGLAKLSINYAERDIILKSIPFYENDRFTIHWTITELGSQFLLV